MKIELLLLCLIGHYSFAAVSPFDYGLNEAKTGVQKYWALYNAHLNALNRNEQVDYSGIKEIEIEIPKEAKSIPLGRVTDFKGLVLTVRNTTKDFYLFSLVNATKEVMVPKSIIDGQSFTGIKELATGMKLLIIEDRTPWVNERRGFYHAVYRKDILLLIGGKALNKTVMPYGVNTKSQPVCYYADVDTKQKKIANLTFRRTADCTYKTCLLQIDAQNNVLLQNLNAFTPADEKLYGDHIIYATNSVNITYKNLNIEGVYCPSDSWGYGVSMDNVYDVRCYNVYGTGSEFGCNNINKSYLKNCNISRYDIHCYGREVKMEKCIFWGSGLSISSVYGDITYNKCILKGYFPVGIRSEYSCNVPYNLYIRNCTYYVTKDANFVIYTGKTNYQTERRPELVEKCLPNVAINGLRIITSEDVGIAYLFFVGYLDEDCRFGNLKDIVVKNVEINGGNRFLISTTPLKLQNEAKIVFRMKGESGVKLQTSIIDIN